VERSRPAPAGFTPEELAARVDRAYALTPFQLATWLHREGLAEIRNGLLTPTDRCRQVADLPD
jgi:hypothetical protein